MGIDQKSLGQLSLFEVGMWRTTVSLEPTHRLAVLCRSIPWVELMEKAIPLLYDEHGIGRDCAGRHLDLRAHLGAYILQTVHGWTDRWTEERLRFYIPTRIFCGYLESEGSLDHTSIEDFRNRFGAKGAVLITQNMMGVAKEFGFTKADDVDMDTTVQHAGITHPTEMKLMGHFMKRLMALHGKMKEVCGKGIAGAKSLSQQFKEGWAELVTAPENPKISDQHCVLESLSLHSTVFDTMPKTYGTDRGMSSIENLELCLSAGVKKVAIQPKGSASALVSRQDQSRLPNRRAGIEPRIAHLCRCLHKWA